MHKVALLFSLLWAGSLQDYVDSSSYQSSSTSSQESESFSQASSSISSSSTSSSTASSSRCPKPPRCPVNETYSPNGSPCPPDSCESIYTSYDCNAANKKPKVAGCRCKDGYLRAGKNCVKSEDCPPPKPVCGQNEHYAINTLDCETSCADKDVNYIQQCQRSKPFTGCMCDNGTYRREDGQCVSYKACGKSIKCTGINEEPNDCGSLCAPTCKTRLQVNNVCADVCVKGCFCVNGTYRHDNGTCVPVEECSPPECKADEYYTNCGTCEVNCDNYNKNQICTKECRVGCYCKDGLIRGPNGVDCIKPEKCPKPTCGQNEQYVKNTLDCESTCALKDVRYIKKCERSTPYTGCMCKNGLYRNDQGKCVTYKQCPPPKCNKNEYYTTCGGCEKSCDNYKNTCLACTLNCREGCYCNKGLIRGTDGISCVKPESCPKPICGDNEIWSDCPDNCFTGKCRDIGARYDCDKAPKCCAPKCICKNGWYRNSKGRCITTEECLKTNEV